MPTDPVDIQVSGLLQDCRDILTISEVADVLRMDEPTLISLLSSGDIRHINIRGTILIPKIFLIDFLANHIEARYTRGVSHSSSTRDTAHLDNQIESDSVPDHKGDRDMATKINQYITINGEKHWIRASSMQDFADKVTKLLEVPQATGTHLFSDYAWNWFETYSKPNVETATAVTYQRQLKLYLIPAFDGLAVEDITPDHIQRLFNSMKGSKTTKEKAKMVLNQILEYAVEDHLLQRNPLKSKRLKITGAASKPTAPYTIEQMKYLVQHIEDIKDPVDRMYLALQALHPLRLEEVLGLKGEDIDTETMSLHIRRAVTHPKRNQPEIKDTKTGSSSRTIGLSNLALPHILPTANDKFVLGGDNPLSYTQVRRMCDRIKKDIDFNENITPIRFRTTVLTDLYDQTKDIKLAQAAAGHTTSAMTLKYYVKGRETNSRATAAVDQAYTA